MRPPSLLSVVALTLALPAAAQSPSEAFIHTLPVCQPGDSYFEVHLGTDDTPGTLLQVYRVSTDGAVTLEQMFPVGDGRVPVFVDDPLTEGEGLAFGAVVPGWQGEPLLVMTACTLLRGDANFDQAIDLEDVDAILRHLGLLPPIADEVFSPVFADVDDDRGVDLDDATELVAWIQSQDPLPLPAVDLGVGLALEQQDVEDPIGLLLGALADEFNHFRSTQAAWLLQEHADLAVPALLSAAGATRSSIAFAGEALRDLRSSNISQGGTRLAAAHLLVVESIRLGRRSPFQVQELLRTSSNEPATNRQLDSAVARFQAWDQQHAGIPVSSRPPVDLAGTGARMPLVLGGAAGLRDGAPESGGPVQDPRVLVVRCVIVDDGTTAHRRYVKVRMVARRLPGGRIVPGAEPVFNCAAWALGCQTLVWLEPLFRNGPTTSLSNMEGLLEAHGYDPWTCHASDPGCEGVILVMSVRCADGPWRPVHMMKKIGDTWTSKNGEGQLYGGIYDPEEFCGAFYNTACPDGSLPEVQFCYYCPD